MPNTRARFARASSLGSLMSGLAGDAISSVGARLLTGRDQAVLRFHEKTARRLLNALGAMKGLPMKVGQILSFVHGAIPFEFLPIYRDALRGLQVKAQPYSWERMEGGSTHQVIQVQTELWD